MTTIGHLMVSLNDIGLFKVISIYSIYAHKNMLSFMQECYLCKIFSKIFIDILVSMYVLFVCSILINSMNIMDQYL